MAAALAVIERRGQYLICRRKPGGFLGGLWEFPGGKREPGESWEACLRREVREELGVSIAGISPLCRLRHRYPGRSVFVFQVFRCRIARGRPRALSAQAIRWVAPNALSRYTFPPANRLLILRLVRPPTQSALRSKPSSLSV